MGILRKIYHASPLFVLNAYSSLYAAWSRIRSLCLPVHQYTGRTHGEDKPLSFVYLGWNRKFLSYWLSRIYSSYESFPVKKLVRFRKLKELLDDRSLQSELAIVELPRKSKNKPGNGLPGFDLPRWLKMYMDVEQSLSIIERRGQIPRRMRKHSLEVEIVSSENDLAFLYEKMYKPYVEKRHNESAIIEPYKKLLQDFKRHDSTLYFITIDGRRVAGLFEHISDGIPYFNAMGVLDGSQDIMNMGVVGALYYSALKNQQENAYTRFNVGGTSPLLKDGLTRYKLLLGARISEIEHQDSIRLKILPLSISPAVRDFFTYNPFTFIENEHMYSAIFVNNPEEEANNEFREYFEKTAAFHSALTRTFYIDGQDGIMECGSGSV